MLPKDLLDYAKKVEPAQLFVAIEAEVAKARGKRPAHLMSNISSGTIVVSNDGTFGYLTENHH